MKIKRQELEQLIVRNRLTSCLECGKCTASCPLGEVFGDVTYGRSPRGIIEKALLDADLVTGDAIWYCLTCDVCTGGCPSGVRFRDFIESVRRLALEAGHGTYGVCCKRCGRYFLPCATQKRIVEQLKGPAAPPEFLFLCPGCRRCDFSQRVKKGLPGSLRVP